MLLRPLNWILLVCSFALVSGCGRLPGKPTEADRWKPPQAVENFAELYDKNCRACHSNGRTLSASIPMNNPIYLAIVPKEVVRTVIDAGIAGTAMPGFSKQAGGLLTEEQIGILTDGIYVWAKGHEVPTENLPPYSAALGDADHGKEVFTAVCATCHGPEGEGLTGKGGSVVDPAYLSLVSNQYLRTVVIAGRPDLGMPGFRERVPGKPMTSEEISDVVAWLASHREGAAPGQSAETAQNNGATQPSTLNQ
jgi:mono/diheme cytochrome c family protein